MSRAPSATPILISALMMSTAVCRFLTDTTIRWRGRE